MKKTLSLLILCSLIWACKQKDNPNVWTKKYELGLYHYIDSASKPGMPDDKERTNYVNYMIKRIKEEIPNGLNSVSKDSLQSLNIKISREYLIKRKNEGHVTEVVSHYEKWSPLIEKGFKDNYVAMFQKIGPQFGNKLCDCMISKLKKVYPDSILLPIPKDVNRKLSLECVEAIKNHKSI